MAAKKTTRKPAPKKIHRIANKVPCLGSAEVHIKQVDNGYIVKVGCKTMVVNSAKVLCEALQDYLERPGKYEKELNSPFLGEDEEDGARPTSPTMDLGLSAIAINRAYHNLFRSTA